MTIACARCRKLRSAVTIAGDNLSRVARRWARDDTDYNREQVSAAKAEVTRAKENVQWHLDTEHGS